MKRYLSYSIVALTFISLMFNTDVYSASLKKVKLQLRWRHQFQFAGYYAAISQGFYKSEGLEVELIEGSPQLDIYNEVVVGRADFGVIGSSIVKHYQKSRDASILAAIFQHSPLVLYTLKESNITLPTDLIGKKVMFRTIDSPEVLSLLVKNGVKLGDFTHVPLSWSVDPLVKGEIDAMSGYITDQGRTLSAKGVKYSVLNPVNFGVDFYGDILFTSKQLVKEDIETVKAFRRASIEGWRYAISNPGEIIDLILSNFPTRKTKEALKFEADSMMRLISPNLVTIGDVSMGRLETIADTYHFLGQVSDNYSVKGLIFHPGSDKGIKRYAGVMAAIATLLLIAISIFSVSKLFKRKLALKVELASREILLGEREKDLEIARLKNRINSGDFSLIEDELVRFDKGLRELEQVIAEIKESIILGECSSEIKRQVGRLDSCEKKVDQCRKDLLELSRPHDTIES